MIYIMKELSNSVDELKDRVKALEQEYDSKIETRKLKHENRLLSESIRDLQEEVERQKESRKRLMRINQRQQEEIQELTKCYVFPTHVDGDLGKENEHLIEVINSHEKKIGELARENSGKSRRIDLLCKKKYELQQEITELLQQNKEFADQLNKKQCPCSYRNF